METMYLVVLKIKIGVDIQLAPISLDILKLQVQLQEWSMCDTHLHDMFVTVCMSGEVSKQK